MGFKTITGIKWTNLELIGLLKHEDSCVCVERIQKHLGLHPFHLTNLNEALREILNTSLNFYDTELNGLLLAYRNPKLLSSLGDILYDTCFVHINIEADFYIFRPEIGKSLKGFVNKIGKNHIGILVHKAFNVSVPKPDDFDYQDWPGYKVKIGQEVRFTLDEIDYTTRLPYIRGSINKEEYLLGCQPFDEQIAATYETELNNSTYLKTAEESRDTKSKIKNKKIIFTDSDVEINLENDSNNKSAKKLKIEYGSDVEKPLKKSSPKKRKRKSSNMSESESELLKPTNEMLDVEIKRAKKKKKTLSNDVSMNSEDEKMHKKTIVKNLINNVEADEINDVQFKEPNTSSKKKKKSLNNDVSIDSEDEKMYKKTLMKTLPDFSELCNSNYAEVETTRKQSKKKKKRSNNDAIVDAELDDSNSLIWKSSDKQSKKKRKKIDEDSSMDTEDEKLYKKTIKKVDLNEGIRSEDSLIQRQSKKRKISVIEDNLMDTENEQMYKDSLKSLVQSVSNGNGENDSELKTHKQKHCKRKSKLSESLRELESDSQKVRNINESESEIEDKYLTKKKTKTKNNTVTGNVNLSETENNDVQNQVTQRKRSKSSKKRISMANKEDEMESSNEIIENQSDVHSIAFSAFDESDSKVKHKKSVRTQLGNNLHSNTKVKKEKKTF